MLNFPIPIVDKQALEELIASRRALSTVALAQELDFFSTIANGTFTINQVADWLNLSSRAAEAMVAVIAASGFLSTEPDLHFRLTDLTRTYLLPESVFYQGLVVPKTDTLLCQLREAFLQTDDEPLEPFAVEMANLPLVQVENFIDRMHKMTLPAGSKLAQQPIFARIENLLDVGGGSGSLSLAIASFNPKIHCTILDLSSVCEIADRNIRQYNLSNQIDTIATDIFRDRWPPNVDGILFGNIFHDWDLDTCYQLAKKSFDALRQGGWVCLHEMLLNESKDGPLVTACMSIAMILHERGKQYTSTELSSILTAVGFSDFKVTSVFGYYSLVTARKP